uniref:IS4 family transposase n=1 Tax=Anisakis simplex TaxID=6269 RepID=A0A0M3JPE4_ANISI
LISVYRVNLKVLMRSLRVLLEHQRLWHRKHLQVRLLHPT